MIDRLPLVFIPGLMDDAHLWAHQIRFLAEAAQPVVADITGQESVEAMAESVLERAPERFALAGFSLGGYVSLAIMRQAPARVLKLALLCTSARADTDARREERRTLIARTRDAGALERHIRDDMGFNILPSRTTEIPLVEGIVAMALRQGPAVFARQHTACMSRPDGRASLPSIACPALVISARDDGVLPPALAEEIAAGIGGARHVTIEECGHYAPLERPHAVTALLRGWILYS